ncbi:MAG: NADH-quinone oxidoreductase subunit J [Pyrinomonadaceae bacterium]
MVTVLFYLLAGLAIGCAISCVYHRNPLYSAVSLIGVFISLACIYLTLAAPFIAVSQILVYAGAIMVLVIFVIMLLNMDEEPRPDNLKYLIGVGGGLGALLIAQALYVFYAVNKAGSASVVTTAAGQTKSIGLAMYTKYLLPVEIVGVLLLMAIVGAMIMSRRFRAERDAAGENGE